jgi:hypothetical protein
VKAAANPGAAPINSKVTRRNKGVTIQGMRDVPEACLMRSLADPCNAPLVHGSYPGVQGYITRTSKFFTVSLGAAETGFVAAIFPANNNSIIQTFTTTGTPTAYSVGQVLNGGTTFLGNAAQLRSLGACLQVWSNLAPLNVTGNISWGSIPIGNFPATTGSTGTYTADFLLTQACQHHAKMTSDTLEVKWRPGALDHYYEVNNTAPLNTTNVGDQNAIIVVAFGLPPSTSYTLRTVNIVEWQPTSASGLNLNISSTAHSPVAPTSTVAKLDNAKTDWWYNIGKAEETIGKVLKHVETGVILAEKIAPMFA